MYVVGFKAFDAQNNPVRNIYTFVKGPFFTLSEAQDVCEKVAKHIFDNYSIAFPKGTSFLVKENENETSIYQLVEGKKVPLITVSSLYFLSKDIDETKLNNITKEMKTEAYKQLATLSLR